MSIVAAPWRRLVHAARWNGRAPQTTTGAARVSDTHCQASNWAAGTIASTTTGTVSTVDTSRRFRRAATSGSAAASGPSSVPGPGSAAV